LFISDKNLNYPGILFFLKSAIWDYAPEFKIAFNEAISC
jgi:hypothetical protein